MLCLYGAVLTWLLLGCFIRYCYNEFLVRRTMYIHQLKSGIDLVAKSFLRAHTGVQRYLDNSHVIVSGIVRNLGDGSDRRGRVIGDNKTRFKCFLPRYSAALERRRDKTLIVVSARSYTVKCGGEDAI